MVLCALDNGLDVLPRERPKAVRTTEETRLSVVVASVASIAWRSPCMVAVVFLEIRRTSCI
jgi:hypothetical protein